MSVGLWLAAATLPALLVGAYLLWWVDRYAWEPAPRFLLTSALAAAGGMPLLLLTPAAWWRGLLLGAGAGDVLHELVAGVDAVRRHERRREHRTHHPGGAATELHVGREDVVSGRPERRAHVCRCVARELLAILAQRPGVVAPRVIRVGLLEARLAHLKNGRQDLTPSQSVNEKGLPGSVEPSRSAALEAGSGTFDSLTVAELKELVEAEEIDLEGAHTKAEIIARLRSL